MNCLFYIYYREVTLGLVCESEVCKAGMATYTREVRRKRYVVVLGKTGAGKSTVANRILQQPNSFKVGNALEGVTKDIQHNVSIITRSNDEEYEIIVTDTVGLYGTATRPKVTMNRVKNHFRKVYPTGINLLVFVLKIGRFTAEEEKALNLIMSYCYDDVADMSALVLTGCENLDEEQRKVAIEEFRSNPRTKEIANFMKQGIFTVGFPDVTLPALKQAYKKCMEDDTEKLLDLVVSTTTMKLGGQIFNDKWWQSCPIL